jgi:alkanesulfonate monooxygenase SsuD/methylene tetrahydromethanopterin reductase-like flavin-dependent oxidoreductase (luciferase family)
MTIEIGIFHNGASDLRAVTTPNGVVVNDGSLEQVHQSYQRVLVGQVRQGILADQLGYDYWFMTEHHFMPEGPEFSPNPLLTEAAIASQTRRIRFGQMANILPWWHPLRVAEQAAMLDVISGGRLEFGIGRGYQPREAETWGWRYGSTIQDQERNRAYFEEAFEIIMKAWTQPSFSHHGEYWSLPPRHTKWHHKATMAYFSMPKAGRRVEDVLNVGPPDMYSMGSPIMASTTTLKELSVFPQPVQKPHPQVWEPVTSERSIRWAARHKVNAFTVPEPTSRLKRNIEIYYEEAEKQGWPDRLNRGRWKHGWDAQKHRGFACCRYVHILRPGHEREDLQRYKEPIELQWDYYGPFGFAAVLSDLGEPMYDLNMKVTADLIMQKEIAIVGTAEEVVHKIMRIKEGCGYDDFMFTAWFEAGGYSTEEIEEQMRVFAAEVMPVLRRECGGGPTLPESTVRLEPERVPAGVAAGVAAS